MTTKIYKYPMLGNDVTIALPVYADVLTARIQKPPYSESEQIVLWAIVDVETAEVKERRFVAVNTGYDWEADYENPDVTIYISTCEASTGIIWHVFEVLQ